MFAVIYRFKVHPGKEDDFKAAWSELTEMIYQNEGSLGSRLHRNSDGDFIAYAQWPDREQWEKSGDKLPIEADDVRLRIRDSCKSIDTLQKLEAENDLLRTAPYSK